MQDCTAKAVGYVEAQWSVVDFVRYETCDEHMRDMLIGLNARWVDGRPPVLNVDFYDDWLERRS
jgi:hypothetical protein